MASLAWMLEEDDQPRAAAVSGESIAAISKRLCRSEKAIWHRARKIGIELPPPRKSGSLSVGRARAEGEEVTARADVRKLAERVAKLEAAACKLPVGPGRDDLLQEVARFRARLSALQATLPPSGEG